MFSDFGLSVVTADTVASDALSDRSNKVQRQFTPSVHAGTGKSCSRFNSPCRGSVPDRDALHSGSPEACKEKVRCPI